MSLRRITLRSLRLGAWVALLVLVSPLLLGVLVLATIAVAFYSVAYIPAIIAIFGGLLLVAAQKALYFAAYIPLLIALLILLLYEKPLTKARELAFK